jgi:predicted RNase H-like HicB family nuclease
MTVVPGASVTPREPAAELAQNFEGTMKRYAIVVEQAGRNYSAYLPDLPGCIATGKTVAAVERLLHEAMEIHMAGLREDGEPVPEPSCVVDYLELPASGKREQDRAHSPGEHDVGALRARTGNAPGIAWR